MEMRGSVSQMRELARLMERAPHVFDERLESDEIGPEGEKILLRGLHPQTQQWDVIVDALRVAADVKANEAAEEPPASPPPPLPVVKRERPVVHLP